MIALDLKAIYFIASVDSMRSIYTIFKQYDFSCKPHTFTQLDLLCPEGTPLTPDVDNPASRKGLRSKAKDKMAAAARKSELELELMRRESDAAAT